MSFFFAPDKDEAKIRGHHKLLTVETLHRLECKACPLDKLASQLKHPKMEPTGSDHPLVYILGEGPGKVEDEEGVQFVGKSGKLLRARIPTEFIGLLRWNNCVRTRPPDNATPGFTEIECCRPSVTRDIAATQPKAIFGFGGVPLKWATGDDGIYKWRGRYLPVKIGNHVCWFFPMLHPAGLLRRRRTNRRTGEMTKSEEELTFERDLARAFSLIEGLPQATIELPHQAPATVPRRATAPRVGKWGLNQGEYAAATFVTGEGGWDDVEIVKQRLKLYSERPATAVDLETASDDRVDGRRSRPFGKNSRILSVAVADAQGAFAFPLKHRETGWSKNQFIEVKNAFVNYLLHAKGIKIAHNLVFELEWCGFFYGLEILRVGRWEDTMAQAYVLDERSGMLSLDNLVLQHFGFRLKGLTRVNRGDLDREPLNSVLTYNALDSLYEYKLYFKQKERLEQEGLESVYRDLHLSRIPTVAITQIFGVEIDYDRVLKFDEKFSNEIKKVRAWISNSKTVEHFKAKTGRTFNPASAGRDVIELYRDILKRPEGKYEDEPGIFKYKVDDETLEKIKTPFSKKLQLFRAVSGNKAKYVDPIHPHSGKCVFQDGLIHPNIHTLFTDTGRTSASFPNEQYWPKRDEGYRELRAEFKSPEDCYLVTSDQGQIEARTIEMAAKDQRYGKYLWDRHDIHGEWAERVAHAYPIRIGGKKFIRDKTVMKTFRTDIKNQWTFPLFFGANAWSVSNYLNIPVDIIDPLVDQFWEEYSGVKDWQIELENFYKKHGYVECLTGRRRRAPISYNELINSPIQGTASDITVDAYTRLSEAAQEMNMWQFQARLEIHDELVFYIPKKTFDRDVEFLADYMLECRHFDFINVPLCIEVSRGPNWYEQEHVMTVFSDDFGKIDRKEHGF